MVEYLFGKMLRYLYTVFFFLLNLDSAFLFGTNCYYGVNANKNKKSCTLKKKNSNYP